MSLYLSRVRIRRTPSAASLAVLFAPAGVDETPDPQRRALWTLFADDADRERDFLWRSEGNGAFYVQSRRPPEDRHRLFEIETKSFEPVLAAGDKLAFSLRANATLDRSNAGGSNRRVDVVMHALTALPKVERAGRRMEVAEREGTAWLARQGEQRGFSPLTVSVQSYRAVDIDRRSQRVIRLGILDLEGLIAVTEPALYLEALANGFGRGKAFGCGLMMIRRA